MQPNGFVMHCLLPAALAALSMLSGCDATPASKAARPEHPAAAPAVPASAPVPAHAATDPNANALEGLSCDGATQACTAPGYAISGFTTACETDGASFGAISDDAPVAAVSRLRGTKAVATLAAGQFVCIHYTAQPTVSDGEPWLYVTAISAHWVPACKGARCGNPGARSRWIDARTAKCAVQGDRYAAGCPAGWVPATSVDVYSMGL